MNENSVRKTFNGFHWLNSWQKQKWKILLQRNKIMHYIYLVIFSPSWWVYVPTFWNYSNVYEYAIIKVASFDKSIQNVNYYDADF